MAEWSPLLTSEWLAFEFVFVLAAVAGSSWVADVTIVRKVRKIIESFRARNVLMEKLLYFRAKMKMYDDKTPHKKGPNPKKYLYVVEPISL